MNISAAAGQGIRCRKLVKDYGAGDTRVQALLGIDLDVSPGELTLLVGPSGCGKTTLISIIAGTLDATGGAVSVFGTDLSRLSKKEKTAFRAGNVGFVFQHFNLMPALTATENAAVPLVIGGSPWPAALGKATAILRSVGLGHRLGALPRQLSGGEQQRVAIARALVHEPRLLVCDEPTSAIDARTGQAIMELIRRVALDANRVALIVTHDPRVLGYGDRIVHLEDGRIVGDERPTEKARSKTLAPGGVACSAS
jgi:putative ABC transport system ATP-binding protein